MFFMSFERTFCFNVPVKVQILKWIYELSTSAVCLNSINSWQNFQASTCLKESQPANKLTALAIWAKNNNGNSYDVDSLIARKFSCICSAHSRTFELNFARKNSLNAKLNAAMNYPHLILLLIDRFSHLIQWMSVRYSLLTFDVDKWFSKHFSSSICFAYCSANR